MKSCQRRVACICILSGGMAQVFVFLRSSRYSEGIGALRHSCPLFSFCVNSKATSDGSLCVYSDRERCGSVHLNTPLNRIDRPGYPHPSA